MICTICGSTYTGHHNSKYCNECLSKGSWKLRLYGTRRVNSVEPSETRKPRVCKLCGKEFTVYYGNQKYCSEKCQHEAYRNSQNAYHKKWYAKNKSTGIYKEKNCVVCGSKYIGRGRSIYCNKCLQSISATTRYRLKRRNEKDKQKETK